MYKSACSSAGGCVEPERDRDGLIAHEPPPVPVENDYSGFDIVIFFTTFHPIAILKI